ncbi:MAG TPA: 2Fe-2S iron-sulfur cluster-binding protein [Chitinophagaceae bacterium]|nr:2Fe-2S iron-sulfur cluster-binding protein [Chitinophagaceae bacterium]
MELTFRVVDVIHETPDTKSFYLEHTQGAGVPYSAGQFLTFIFFEAGHETRRSYSLGSAPGVDDRMFITVKRKPNGSISRRLFEHCKTGDTLTAIEPSGRFVIEEPFAKRYIFIAAGSGITPVFSLIKQLLFFKPAATVLLINQCRNETNVIYAQQLQHLQQQFAGRFTVTQLYSQPVSHKYFSQRLNNTLFEICLKQQLARYSVSDMQCYVCGPPVFMLMAQFTLKLLHFKDEQIHKEQFVIIPPKSTPLLHDTMPRLVKLRYRKKEYFLQVTYPASILDAALKEGIQLPYSCRAGICSTCMATCIHGKVVMSNNEVLTEKELAAGKILTCTGFAATDCEIITGEEIL